MCRQDNTSYTEFIADIIFDLYLTLHSFANLTKESLKLIYNDKFNILSFPQFFLSKYPTIFTSVNTIIFSFTSPDELYEELIGF